MKKTGKVQPFLRGLSRIVLEWELRIFGRHFDGVWYSNRDQMANYFRSDTKIVELPNLPPEVSSLYRCDSVRDNMLMTVGAFGYMPNTYGVDRFLSDVWPIVKAEFPDMKYLIVGRGVSDVYRAKWAQVAGVTIMGYVDDLDAIYSRALASVVPIDQGGGTCIKTLDSLAHSRICLSTTYGSRGIPPDDLRNGNNGICVYETADQFVTSLKKIVYDLPWRVERESAARTYIENNYSQERFCSKVSQLIMSVKGKVASA